MNNLRIALACSVAGFCLVGTSPAFAKPREFNVPAMPAKKAVQIFADQADVDVLASGDTLRGVNTNRVNGKAEVDDAMAKLLRGTPLKAIKSGNDTYLIKPNPQPTKIANTSYAEQQSPRPMEALTAEAPENESFGVEEIVVTAQKREESLQDTPISIAAFTSETLKQKGIGSLSDMMEGAIPSLRIVPYAGRASAVSMGMRGMVPFDATQVTRDPTVGIYIDGVYLGRVQGLGMELADIERIEILRGPQGTLFGRNTIGGAVSVVTKKPTGVLGLDLKGGIGNRDGRSLAAHMNLPAFGNISLKLDGVYEARDGWVKNPMTPEMVPSNYSIGGQSYDFGDVSKNFHAVKRYGFRASTLFEPADNLSFLYAFDWARDKSTGGYWHILSSSQTLLPVMGDFDDGRAKVARMPGPMLPSTAKTKGHTLTATWEVGSEIDIRSITGYRKLDSDQWDQDNGGLSGFYSSNGAVRLAQGRLSFANVKSKQFSQELQLIGTMGGDLNYVTGIYYFHEKGRDTATVFRSLLPNSDGTSVELYNPPITSNTVDGVPNQLQDRASRAKTESKALFGQVTWSPSALDNRLHVTVGGRYTDDKKNGRLAFLGGVPVDGIAFDFKSKRFDPMATLAYDFSDDINVYVKYGRAYRAGGANTRSATLRTFNEEELDSYEIGLKADVLDRRARINLAAYTSWLKAAQIDFNNPLAISSTETVNVPGKIKVSGLEADITLVPVVGLSVNFSYVYTKASSILTVNPFSGLEEPVQNSLTPRHAVSGSFDYDFGYTPIGSPRIHFDVNSAGGYFSNQVPSFDSTKNKTTWLVNGRLSLAEIPVLNDSLELSVWGKNLTNRTYDQSDLFVAGNHTAFYNEPRTYGVEMRVVF